MQQNAMEKTIQFRFIEKESDLKKIAGSLEAEKIIAADVEADSMFNFREKICLVQIASKKHNFVIDTVKIRNLSPLKPVFSNQKIQKVFHGADFDVRSLFRDFGITINGLFDTELASRFLGFKETGLDSVLKNKFDIEMDKRFRKKDWSKRPLPDEMMAYAAKDVAYLLSLAKMLTKELKEAGRLSWVKEECEVLSRVRSAPSLDTEPLFIKFRGAGRFDPKTLAVLEELLQYRITVAEKKDVPPFKVMSNNVIVRLAKEKPGSLVTIENSSILSKKQIDMYGRKVVETIKRATRLPESKLPCYPRRRAPVLKASVHKRIKILKEWRGNAAEQLLLDPGLFLNKNMLTAIASQQPVDVNGLKNIQGLKKWQRRQFGEEIMAVLKNIP
jgi:ribonuclease D